ncbi:MAG TPA: hypothetical protein VI461_10290, partial [Chitinophagaceae bacterium]|nr:hypothetical protein [Chitinophagaceae bacterium]
MKKWNKSFNWCLIKQPLPGLKPISFLAFITPALRLELKSGTRYRWALTPAGWILLKHFIRTFSFLLLSIQAFTQTETFDIATYTPPKDWKKDAKEGVVNYTNVNTATGGFCVITIYASTA